MKPIIKSGAAPWAHTIAMETKEHIFLFIIPLALTTTLLLLLNKEDFRNNHFKKSVLLLSGLIVLIGFVIGIMGFMISAAARWG